MGQLLLFRDPQPLVERFGSQFFRSAPEKPGVYLMYDRQWEVLYVGKAKNIRKRLASYRIANPEQLPPRRLKLLHAVERIDFELCCDETEAIQLESSLLQRLRPRFNRAGKWRAAPRVCGWRMNPLKIELTTSHSSEPGWNTLPPSRLSAETLRRALVRLIWAGLNPADGFSSMHAGWFFGPLPKVASIHRKRADTAPLEELHIAFRRLSSGNPHPLVEWINRQARAGTMFEAAQIARDLEAVVDSFELANRPLPDTAEAAINEGT